MEPLLLLLEEGVATQLVKLVADNAIIPINNIAKNKSIRCILKSISINLLNLLYLLNLKSI
jgi:hypothetical protein